MDAGGSQWWLTASTMTPQHIWAPPCPNFPNFGPHLHMYNSVRVHPYTHPQHMKVLKHVVHADICNMINSLLRYILLLSISASTGSVTSEAKSVTSPVTSTNKTLTLGGS